MARYTGPACRLCRRVGERLMLKGGRCMGPKCAADRRRLPPGQTGSRRRRLSDRGVQLREKQKARYDYGMMEKQFRRFFAEAAQYPGVTSDKLLELLERRLDNVVFRLGFATSRAQARQLVCHGHISVSGRKTDIPSYRVDVGDVIAWSSQGAKTEYYKGIAEGIASVSTPGWLELDKEHLSARVIALPKPGDTEIRFDQKAIIEYYSR